MGKNFDQLLNELRDLGEGASVHVTFVMHQDNQLVGYATGNLDYHRHYASVTVDGVGGLDQDVERLASSPDQPLQYFFSDRMLDINPSTPSPSSAPFGHSPTQPFSVNAAEKLGMSFGGFGSISTNPATVRFTALSEGNTAFTVEFAPLGNLLYGTLADSTVYTVSFDGPFPPVRPPS